MKSVSFVPKTVPAGGPSRSPLDRLPVDWHRSKLCIFINFATIGYLTSDKWSIVYDTLRALDAITIDIGSGPIIRLHTERKL